VAQAVAPVTSVPIRRQSRAWLSLRSNPAFWFGGCIVLALLLMAIFAPVLAPHDPLEQDRRYGLNDVGDPVGPSARFPLGTDHLGRDYASRLMYGARTSLVVGITATILATVIGVLVGATAAYAGTRSIRLRRRGRGTRLSVPVDSFLMRLTDVFLAFPALLLAMAISTIVGPSLLVIAVVIALVLWASMARIMYGRVLIVKENDWVEAARALGVSGTRTFARHILPHISSIVVVYATLGISAAVLTEAALAYLGVGVPPPAPSWGQMIAEHVGLYAVDPRLVLLPGAMIMLTVLGFSLLGDALRDALDPVTASRPT
jgi:ABC-type dipeptide/oligopeptide/nickel transport system permease subunit